MGLSILRECIESGRMEGEGRMMSTNDWQQLQYAVTTREGYMGRLQQSDNMMVVVIIVVGMKLIVMEVVLIMCTNDL